jgi:hypothetical protein
MKRAAVEYQPPTPKQGRRRQHGCDGERSASDIDIERVQGLKRCLCWAGNVWPDVWHAAIYRHERVLSYPLVVHDAKRSPISSRV